MGKFDNFTVTHAPYNTLANGTNIDLTILTPKSLTPGKHPLLVRYHGGFLFTGARTYELWFPEWVLQYAVAQNAILVTPDYRLLPEARGVDILSDIAALWKWVRSSTDLAASLGPAGIEADLGAILTCGESAGGYLAVQSALLHPEVGVRAVICQYGVLDIQSSFFTVKGEKRIMGAPQVRETALDEYVAAVEAGRRRNVRVEQEPGTAEEEGVREAMLCAIQQGRYADVLGPESKCYPFENLERVKTKELPPIWLFHGRQDSAVPVEGSERFFQEVKRLHPYAEVKLSLVEGEHGFDGVSKLNDEWLREGLEWVGRFWPGTGARTWVEGKGRTKGVL